MATRRYLDDGFEHDNKAMSREMNKDDLLRRIIAEKVNIALEETFGNESGNVHEIIDKLDRQGLGDDFKGGNKSEPWMNQYDYAAIIDSLNSSSTVTRIRILDKLLGSRILDTKQQFWTELSQSLHKCFVSASNDIFTKTLQIHHRMIAFPNTSCDGYLSLLKSTFLLLNSPKDFNNRVLQSLQLIIDSQGVVFKILLHASRNIIDDVVTAFVTVVTFNSVFDTLGVVDPDSTWLNYYCYGSYIRNMFFSCLKEKNSEFVKSVVSTFIKRVNDNEGEVRHYGLFLLYLWQSKNNRFFPTELSAESTLETVVTKMNHRKNDNLTILVVGWFTNNPFLLTPKVLDVLIEPLFSINRNNCQSSITSNSYIFTIISQIAKSPNFHVLFGVCSNFRKGRSRQITRSYTNLPQRIVDLTIMSFRNEDASNLPLLLECCANIYSSHPVSLIHVNPTKLLQNLQEFYRLSWKNDPKIRRELLCLFEFFYVFFGPTLRILGCDNEILVDLLSFTSSDTFSVVTRIGGDKSGFEFVKSHSGQIVKPYLERVWSEDVNDDSELTKFVFFIFVVKLETRSVVALLSDDDEGTVVETDRSVNLADLIEKSLNEGDPDEEFLGLMMMKVLVTNLDLLLYLQVNYQMQEKLANLNNDVIDAQSSLRINILVSLENVGFCDSVELISCENELRASVENDSTSGDFNWVAQARRTFKNSLDDFDPSRLGLLLQRIPKIYVYRKIELNWPPSDCVYYQLHPEDFSGVSLIISFGQKTGLLKVDENTSHQENLTLLIKQSRVFLRHQPEHFFGFDWFIGIIYLICEGDFESCKLILINFTNTQVTALIWATFGKEFDTGLQENFFQHLSVVLEENCTCFEALTMLGISMEVLVQSWLKQCFFNYLTIAEICNFLTFSLLYPVECLIYYMVAIFHHLNDAICTLTHSQTVENILNVTTLNDFRLNNYMTLIEKLMKRYKSSHKL